VNVNDFEYALYLQLQEDVLWLVFFIERVKLKTEVNPVYRYIYYQEAV
jgi:hypothetical protein